MTEAGQCRAQEGSGEQAGEPERVAAPGQGEGAGGWDREPLRNSQHFLPVLPVPAEAHAAVFAASVPATGARLASGWLGTELMQAGFRALARVSSKIV